MTDPTKKWIPTKNKNNDLRTRFDHWTDMESPMRESSISWKHCQITLTTKTMDEADMISISTLSNGS